MILGFFALASCNEEDPGPRQQDNRSYTVVDFDRLEIGAAVVVTVRQGNNYSIQAEGDRRNLDDLQVYKSGDVLVVRFSNHKDRQYATYLTITMPVMSGVDFSGAVDAQIENFDDANRLDVSLSGASLMQLDMNVTELYFNLSGASQLRLFGEGQMLDGTISGASLLSAFDYPVLEAKLIISGASNGKVMASQEINASVSGASVLVYRGSPQLNVESTGSSVVRRD